MPISLCQFTYLSMRIFTRHHRDKLCLILKCLKFLFFFFFFEGEGEGEAYSFFWGGVSVSLCYLVFVEGMSRCEKRIGYFAHGRSIFVGVCTVSARMGVCVGNVGVCL